MLRKFASFLRWRLKPNRWIGKGFYTLQDRLTRIPASPRPAGKSPLAEQVGREGYARLGTLDVPVINLTPYAGRAVGKPFIDISDDHPELVDKTFAELFADEAMSAMVHSYFDGYPWLWNVALNYSDPSEEMTDSQLWHFDYGDTRQLHLLVNFTDIGPLNGPFTFLSSSDSDRVTRHPFIIERLTDADLAQDYGIEVGSSRMQLCGKRGEVFANDPGRLMHQGARCSKSRLVMFITFTSRAPMSKGGSLTIKAGDRKRFGRLYNQACPNGILPASTFR